MATLVSFWPPQPPCAPGTLYTLPKEMHPWFSSAHLSSSPPPPPPIKYLVSVVGETHIPGSPMAFTHFLMSLPHTLHVLLFFSTLFMHRGNGEMEWGNERLKHIGFCGLADKWPCQTCWNLSSVLQWWPQSNVKSVRKDALWIECWISLTFSLYCL